MHLYTITYLESLEETNWFSIFIYDIGLISRYNFLLCYIHLKLALLFHKQGLVATGIATTVIGHWW